MRKEAIILSAAFALAATSCQRGIGIQQWVTTTESSQWVEQSLDGTNSDPTDSTVVIRTSSTQQVIDGFGTCFNELGWDALTALGYEKRTEVMQQIFDPAGDGTRLTMARMPIGANDFSLDYYSYDDVEGDFALEHFSIDHDRQTLIPYIKSALELNPKLRLWASPWTPPTWMKRNKHYACNSTAAIRQMVEERLAQMPDSVKHRMGGMSGMMGWLSVDNGLAIDQTIAEGEDAFIMEPQYLQAYARYFGKFLDAYRAEGINIYMVMPQNEFNSAQPYPSCVWRAESLAQFISKHLGPQIEGRGVLLFYGTVERAQVSLTESVLQNADARRYINGLGFQWAGKDALPKLHQLYPNMPKYQTEQECGDGQNDWPAAMHAWDLMRHYFAHGVKAYFYWNTVLAEGGVSRWGWSQNSLVTVNKEAQTYTFTPEFYVLKHLSHYVQTGAKYLALDGTYSDAMAFQNPDGTIVVALANQHDEPVKVNIALNDGQTTTISLDPQSINTLLLKAPKE